jgi:hypothetical protein
LAGFSCQNLFRFYPLRVFAVKKRPALYGGYGQSLKLTRKNFESGGGDRPRGGGSVYRRQTTGLSNPPKAHQICNYISRSVI